MPTALTAADTIIQVRRHRLEDNSEVFDVTVDALPFSACTEADAEALAEAIATALDKHTTHIAKIKHADEWEWFA